MSKSILIKGAGLSIPKFVKKKKKAWKGSNILDRKYFIFGILGKRRSGKSTLIYNLIEKFSTKETIVLFFVNTFMKDENYKEIREYLDKKEIEYIHYDDIIEGVSEFIDTAKMADEERNDKENPKNNDSSNQLCHSSNRLCHSSNQLCHSSNQLCHYNEMIKNKILGINIVKDNGAETKKPKKLVKKEYIIVFDDVSDSLRETAVKKLVKNSFHYRSKVILSTQGHADFSPDIYANLDYLALFKNFNEYALEHIYNKIEVNLTFEEFKEIYHETTNDSYDFLFIDRNNEEYRINLNKKIKLT